MLFFPNAKINLGLYITEKMNNGFHRIQTVFYPVALCDALELLPAEDKRFAITFSGMQIPGTPEENLCVKAWKLMQGTYDLPPVKMHLHKAIPMGAGLGGGSSDAAFSLKLVNQVFNLQLDNKTLSWHARKLGSDCAFFIHNKPVAASGRGDVFTDISLDLSGYFLVVVKPNVSISTAKAYAMVKPKNRAVEIQRLVSEPVGEWKNLLINDFEKPIIEQHPQIGGIKNELYRNGALYVSMSGSGSAVYGLFDKDVELSNCFGHLFSWKGKL